MIRKAFNFFSHFSFAGRRAKLWRQYFHTAPIALGATALYANEQDMGIWNESAKPIAPLKIAEPVDLSHAFLLKQSCAQAADSASRVVTQSLLAFNSAVEEYIRLLERMINLLDLVVQLGAAGESNATLQDKLVELRSDVSRWKTSVHEMDYLVKASLSFLNNAADVAFLAGVENISTLSAERIYSVKRQIQEILKEVSSLEKQYNSLQEELVKLKSNQLS